MIKSIKEKILLATVAIMVVIIAYPTVVSATEISKEDLSKNSYGQTLYEATDALTEEDKEIFNNLSDEEIDSKEIDISESYKAGEILSEEDTIFLLNLMNEEDKKDDNLFSTMGFKSQQSMNLATAKFGTRVIMTGTMYQDIAVVAGTSSFRGNIKLTRDYGSLNKVALKTHHSAYGIAGWNGSYPSIGVVYKGNVGMSKTTYLNTTQMDKETRYNSVAIVYTTTYTQATVTTSKGDQYTLTSSTWKRTF